MGDTKTRKAPALRLIDAAERLIGELGFDRVSLQQIATEAGHANKFAVQYYFGSKLGIVNAVFETRLPVIDARRRKLLDAILAQETASIRDLVAVLFQPVVEEVNAHGEHAFARFADRIRHLPQARAFWVSAAQLARQVYEMMQEKALHLSPADFEMRFSLATDMLTGAMRLLDDQRRAGGGVDQAALVSHALDMCAAGLACPVSPARPWPLGHG